MIKNKTYNKSVVGMIFICGFTKKISSRNLYMSNIPSQQKDIGNFTSTSLTITGNSRFSC